LVTENCHVQESRQTVVGWVLGMMVVVYICGAEVGRKSSR